MIKHQRIVADLALLLAVVVWGTTFPLMKDALEGIKPMNFIFLRFTLAFLLLGIINRRKLNKLLSPQLLKMGLYLGLALSGGYIFQISGLVITTASKAGFITGLSVVIVPIIATVYFKKLPPVPVLAGVFLALLGLLMMNYDGQWIFNLGDLLVFLCALSFGMHIFLVGIYVKREDPALLTMVQIGVVAVVALIGSVGTGELHVAFSGKIWTGIIYMAVMATGFTFFVQSWAQRFTSAVRTAIIFSMEPVFAMIFSYLLLAEPIGQQSLIGGGAILLGMLLAELGGHHKNETDPKE